MGYEFEWDSTKADANVKKHGVALKEAVTVFADSLSSIWRIRHTPPTRNGTSSSAVEATQAVNSALRELATLAKQARAAGRRKRSA